MKVHEVDCVQSNQVPPLPRSASLPASIPPSSPALFDRRCHEVSLHQASPPPAQGHQLSLLGRKLSRREPRGSLQTMPEGELFPLHLTCVGKASPRSPPSLASSQL